MLDLRVRLKQMSNVARASTLVLALALLLQGCGLSVRRDLPSEQASTPQSPPDAIPRSEPPSRYGNPASYEVFGKRYYTLKTSAGFRERGVASWYGKKFHGRRTSSGETYDMYQMTAAHKALPLPSYVRVTNLENGRSAVLKVNDRGPFHDNRVIDLSYSAALKLDMIKKGTAFVEIVAVDGARGDPAPQAPVLVDAQPQAAPTPPQSERAGVFIQVGAFRERANAERLSARVKNLVDDPVLVRESHESGQAIYRVHVGPIVSVVSADQLVTKLFDIGIDQHQFVSN